MRSTQVSNLGAAISSATVRVTADQSYTAAAFVTTTLTRALAANTNYLFKAHIRGETSIGGAIASGLNFAINALAAGATLVAFAGLGAAKGALSTTLDNAGEQLTPGSSLFTADLANGVTDTIWVITVWGLITVGANATTLQINANDGPATGTTKVLAGSFLEVSTVA